MSDNLDEKTVALVMLSFNVTLALDPEKLEVSLRRLLKDYFSGMLMVVDEVTATLDETTGEFSMKFPERTGETFIKPDKLGIIN